MVKRGFFGKEDAVLLVQLLNAMTELSEKLDKYKREKNIEKFESVKREIAGMQRRINELI